MGHERVGTLPKTKSWQGIVGLMTGGGAGGASGGNRTSDFDPGAVASATLEQVRRRFRQLQQDDATTAAFTFLIEVAVAARPAEDDAELRRLALGSPDKITPLKLSRALQKRVAAAAEFPEYAAIAESAAIDALAQWYDANKPRQAGLFASFDDSYSTWHQTSTGAGFCEMSRLFFANLLRRYLNYFLEREASRVIPSLAERDRFRDRMGAHVEDVSKHAFETSKIVQSYAAGWFNSHAKNGVPSEREIDGFLSYGFGKMRDELTREPVDK
jgi:hypothetical protein